MRVNYITFCDERMPAYRYRMEMPGKYIGDYEITIYPVDADIHVYSKPYHDDPYILANMIETASRSPFVFDLCDDLFWRTSNVTVYIRQMMEMAEVVTTSTEAMRELIFDQTGIDSVVISDPYEFDEKPIKDISEPKYLWFGTATNLVTLKGFNEPIEIVCQMSESVKKILDSLECDYTFTEWSLESMKAAFDRNNIAYIPSDDSRKRSVKSPNRVVESIRQGLSVITDPVPSYLQFSEWISFDKPKQLVPEAQQYVRENFDISIIGEQWKNLFGSISGADRELSMAGSM